MAAAEQLVEEIRSIFSGSLPNVFQRMEEAGQLEQHWPGIRAVLVAPEPLSPAVVQALFIVFSLRCSSSYCFVLHSLTLSSQGVSPISIAELARLFDMPNIEPDHARWSRLLKLAWLSHRDGPQRHAAAFLLQRECSAAEVEQIERVYVANRAINSFTVEPTLTLDDEPMLETFPEQLRALVPDFVQFHMLSDHPVPVSRPVATMCSLCRRVRSVGGDWYPYEAAAGLLAPDVLFSHGLCLDCLDDEGVPAEYC